jgi:hypothetical protein
MWMNVTFLSIALVALTDIALAQAPPMRATACRDSDAGSCPEFGQLRHGHAERNDDGRAQGTAG